MRNTVDVAAAEVWTVLRLALGRAARGPRTAGSAGGTLGGELARELRKRGRATRRLPDEEQVSGEREGGDPKPGHERHYARRA